MPYPAKTSAEHILDAAVAVVEREGQAGLSLRGLAAELRLTPRSLYRYYPSREALLAAVAVQTSQWLLADLRAALGDGDNLSALARRYLQFANERPALFELYMTCDSLSAEQRQVYEQGWRLVVQALEPLAGTHSKEAAITLWAYLYGLIGLERSGVYDENGDKPRETTEFGVNLLLAGLRAMTP